MLSQLHEACVQGDLDVVQGLHNGGGWTNGPVHEFATEYYGKYSTHMFTDEAIKVVDGHDTASRNGELEITP